jgi:hypothetical protein
MTDFFISYTGPDKAWAERLASWLDEAGFTYILQARDFVAGSNFVIQMHEALRKCQRMLLVLSPDYLSARFPLAEWTAGFAKDPTGAASTLIGVRVRECRPDGLLAPIVHIDLVDLSVVQARGRFLSEIMAAIETRRTLAAQSPTRAAETKPPSVSQTATGKNITQVAGDYNRYDSPPTQKIFITPGPNAIKPDQRQQVQSWIENLVENTVGIPRDRAFGMWWKRFKNRFGLDKYEELSATNFGNAGEWYRQQMAILTRKLKTKVPDAWRSARFGAIKKAMRKLGFDDTNKAVYYERIAARLKMKKPFSSLTDLTKRDLDRVYNLVTREARDNN